jgi:hypothetical protein
MSSRGRAANISNEAAARVLRVMGVVALVATVAVATHRILFVARSAEAEAAVVDTTVIPGGRHGPAYCPVFSFTPSGSTTAVVARGDVCQSGGPAMANGSRVAVRYDPSDPSSVELAEQTSPVWIIVVILASLTAFFGAMAFTLGRDRRRSFAG